MIEYVQQNLQSIAVHFMVFGIIALACILALWVAWAGPAEARADRAENDADALRRELERKDADLARARDALALIRAEQIVGHPLTRETLRP